MIFYGFRKERLKSFWKKLKFWRRDKSRTRAGARPNKEKESRFIELTPSEVAAEEAKEKKLQEAELNRSKSF